MTLLNRMMKVDYSKLKGRAGNDVIGRTNLPRKAENQQEEEKEGQKTWMEKFKFADYFKDLEVHENFENRQ